MDEVHNVHVPQLEEVSLEFFRAIMPAKKWEEASRDPRMYFDYAFAGATGLDGDRPKVGYVANKGESYATTVKVPKEHVVGLMVDADKFHVFARKTVRGEEKDTENVPMWLNVKRDMDLLTQVREARDHARKQAGEFFRGLSVRYRQGYQIGVRVIAQHAPMLRSRILPRQLQPAEEVRDVIGRRYFRVYGMPADLDKRALSVELFRAIGWATLPQREWTRPGSSAAEWVVAADESPPKWIFYISMPELDEVSPVVIQEEMPKGAKGRVLVPNVGTRKNNMGPPVDGARYFRSCWAEDDEDMLSEEEGRDAGEEEVADAHAGHCDAFGLAAAAVAVGRSKAGARGKANHGQEGASLQGGKEMRGKSPLPGKATDKGGGACVSEKRLGETDRSVLEPQRHFIGEGDMLTQIQGMFQATMQRLDMEKDERQVELHRMQEALQEREMRSLAFEQQMLAFKMDTERNYETIRSQLTKKGADFGDGAQTFVEVRGGASEIDAEGSSANERLRRGRKGPRDTSSSHESSARRRRRSRSAEGRGEIGRVRMNLGKTRIESPLREPTFRADGTSLRALVPAVYWD